MWVLVFSFFYEFVCCVSVKNCNILLVNFSFNEYKLPFLSVLSSFGLLGCLLLACLFLCFICFEYLFLSFYPKVSVFNMGKCVFCRQYKGSSCFLIPLLICFIGELRLLLFTTELYLLIFVILFWCN